MRPPADARLRWALVVLAGGLLLLALDAWWLATHRHGFPLNIDEAAYTTIGLNDYLGLKDGGLHGWWEAFQNQAPNAPLLPALASLLYLGKAGLVEGFGALGAFQVLLGLAVYGIGERLVGPRLGALCGLVAMTAPGALAYAHVYIFALPAAALLACAVYALLRSEGLQRSHWALACGVALGLMLLARTMAVAFVPGVLVAALLTLLARERGRAALLRGAANLGLLCVAGFATAAVWYWHNLQPVLDYLTNYGYGGKSAEFGAEHGLFSWDRWTAVAVRMNGSDLLVPLALALLAGLLAVLVTTARSVHRAPDRAAALRAVAGGDAFAIAVIVLAGYAALTSSRNAGFGFTLPLSLLLVPLAAIALRRFPAARAPALAALALIAALNLTASTDLWSGLSRNRSVAVPGLGDLRYTSGLAYALADIRTEVSGPESRFAPRDRGWLRADKLLAAWILREEGPPLAAFASRNRVLNTNTVGLAAVANFQRPLALGQLVADDGDSVPAYERRLTNPVYGQPQILMTTSTEAGDYEPHVTQAYAETAARRLGFRLEHTMNLPDGRELRVWSRLP